MGWLDTELQAQGVVFYLDKVRASLANIPKTGLEALVEELKGSKQSVADFCFRIPKNYRWGRLLVIKELRLN